MRVLIVTSYFPPEIGAASVRISNLANGFKKYGAQVDILAPLPNYPLGKIFPEYKGRLFKKETIDNHTVYRYWTYATISKNPFLRAIGMFSFAIMIWLFGLRRKLINEYDCIIVQSPPLLVSYSAIKLFKCIYKKQVILNVSDLWPLSAVELGVMKEGSLSYKLFSHCERKIYQNADAIMGQSEEIIKYVDGFVPEKEKFVYRNLQPNI